MTREHRAQYAPFQIRRLRDRRTGEYRYVLLDIRPNGRAHTGEVSNGRCTEPPHWMLLRQSRLNTDVFFQEEEQEAAEAEVDFS